MNAMSQVALGLVGNLNQPSATPFTKSTDIKPMSGEEYLAILHGICDNANKRKGDLKGFDCKHCLNRGYFLVVDEENMTKKVIPCKCQQTRDSLRRMERSGLANTIREKTFKTFQTHEPWQEKVKSEAMAFAKEGKGWFFIAGQSGCGKTHICTAICREFLIAGRAVNYVTWRDVVHKLRSAVNDSEEYSRELRPLATVGVLYIDDFLKVGKNAEPTTSDINIAYEIINARYLNHNLVTIISSERGIEEIMVLDGALAGRIYEKCEYMPTLFGTDKNWRMR